MGLFEPSITGAKIKRGDLANIQYGDGPVIEDDIDSTKNIQKPVEICGYVSLTITILTLVICFRLQNRAFFLQNHGGKQSPSVVITKAILT
jgi:hypothetical protein